MGSLALNHCRLVYKSTIGMILWKLKMLRQQQVLNELIQESWQVYTRFEDQPFLVKPSIPILFFGDSDRYLSSELKVITLGLNPSKAEFPEKDSFCRFSKARTLYPGIVDGRLRIPMMSISQSDVMPIRSERSDARLS